MKKFYQELSKNKKEYRVFINYKVLYETRAKTLKSYKPFKMLRGIYINHLNKIKKGGFIYGTD